MIPSPPRPRSLNRPGDSRLVRAVANALTDQGFVRNHLHVYDQAGSRYPMLFAHIKRRINVEVGHSVLERPDRRRRAAVRDARLQRDGWTVLRFVPVSGDVFTVKQLTFDGRFRVALTPLARRVVLTASGRSRR